jgi:hypothetical protein
MWWGEENRKKSQVAKGTTRGTPEPRIAAKPRYVDD